MSKSHARVSLRDGDYVVEDLESRNGTFLNGRRVQQEKLPTGSVLSIGDTLLVYDPVPDEQLLSLQGDQQPPLEGVVGESRTIEALRGALWTAARSGRGNVLLRGPTGVGKEVAARAFAELCGPSRPFVAVNCAMLEPTLASSLLFGHKKGSFTGASSSHDGIIRSADGGILFLDELAELPREVQARLLRTVEDGIVRSVGSESRELYRVELRIVAATNEAIETDGEKFREDLLARLCDWFVPISPLCERKADVLVLFRHFYERETKRPPDFSRAFAEALLIHDWPHNARGLRTLAIQTAATGNPTRRLTEQDLPSSMLLGLRDHLGKDAAPISEGQREKREIEEKLKDAGGNVSEAARKLKMDRSTLRRRMKKYGLQGA